VFGGEAWLASALVDAQIPATLHQSCVNLLIDAFHNLLV